MIEIKNLKFKYHQDQPSYILDDVSFHVKRGEWLSIVGHNGSGKSTTARLIDGLLVAESGQIIVDGQELTEENVWSFKIQIINLLGQLLKTMLLLVLKIKVFPMKKWLQEFKRLWNL